MSCFHKRWRSSFVPTVSLIRILYIFQLFETPRPQVSHSPLNIRISRPRRAASMYTQSSASFVADPSSSSCGPDNSQSRSSNPAIASGCPNQNQGTSSSRQLLRKKSRDDLSSLYQSSWAAKSPLNLRSRITSESLHHPFAARRNRVVEYNARPALRQGSGFEETFHGNVLQPDDDDEASHEKDQGRAYMTGDPQPADHFMMSKPPPLESGDIRDYPGRGDTSTVFQPSLSPISRSTIHPHTSAERKASWLKHQGRKEEAPDARALLPSKQVLTPAKSPPTELVRNKRQRRPAAERKENWLKHKAERED